MKTSLTAERVREVLDYNSETGVFKWREGRLRADGQRHSTAGQVAGTMSGNKRRYVVIKVDDCTYLAHRLAWLYVHGEWPPTIIDHEDRNPANNAIRNLRPATKRLNALNLGGPNAGNATGALGVYTTRNGKFRAIISTARKQRYIGTFATVGDARQARECAQREVIGSLVGSA